MDVEMSKRVESCPKLLDLMVTTKERAWMMRANSNGLQRQEKKLELKLMLGPPGSQEEAAQEEPSTLSLGYFPKASKTPKRVFLETIRSQNEVCSSPSHAAGANTSNSQPRTSSVPVVGWPPIRSFRKNLASSSSKTSVVLPQNGASETAAKPEISKKGLFVKINMDGIPIGRKVDLNAYDSYGKLSSAVEELFQGLLAAQKDHANTGAEATVEQNRAFQGLLDGGGEYTLVYEDNEGDRMLVGDVPWEMFVSTAKRLRVLKSSELSTLALGSESRKRTAAEC